MCLRQLKEEDRSWTFVIDVDECLLVNPMTRNEMSSIYNQDCERFNSSQPSSVLKTVQQLIMPDEQYAFTTPCLMMARKQFSPQLSTNRTAIERTISAVNTSAFQTFMWDKEGQKRWPTKRCSRIHHTQLPGKSMVDLKRLKAKDLSHEDNDGNPHAPLSSICPDVFQKPEQSLLIVHHYAGTQPQWEYRTDPRGLGLRRTKYRYFKDFFGVNTNTDAQGWLGGFINMVGQDEATYLLKDVGKLEPRTKRDSTTGESQNQTLLEKFGEGDLVQVNYAKHDEKPKFCEAEIVHALHEYDTYNIVWSDDCTIGYMVHGSKIRRNGTDNVICEA